LQFGKMGSEINTFHDSRVIEKERVFSLSHTNRQMTWIIESRLSDSSHPSIVIALSDELFNLNA
jgi:hypothetical protein